MEPPIPSRALAHDVADAWPMVITVALAVVLPSLMAHHAPPSPTVYNQLLAHALWGVAVLCVAMQVRGRYAVGPSDRPRPSVASNGADHRHASGRLAHAPLAAVVASMLLIALAAIASGLWRALPSSLSLTHAATMASALCVLMAGALAGKRARALTGFIAGWLVLGVISSIVGLVQVFAPELADGTWIARSNLSGRAVGNVRQPNQLATLMLGAAAAVVPATMTLHRRGWSYALWVAAALYTLFVIVIVLTASRTGLLGLLVLAVWGLVDRRLAPTLRVLLVAGPALYALAWLGLSWWSQQAALPFAGATRLTEGDLSSSRWGIWRDTWTLIVAHPWWGVGLGEFNLAWSMSVLPQRPVAFFDHTHQIALQWLVELGVPLGLLVLALLTWGVLHAVRRAWLAWPDEARDDGAARRTLAVMLVMMGMHSMLEYPLWYAHFLLPTAFALGLCLRPVGEQRVGLASAADEPVRLAVDKAQLALALGGFAMFVTTVAAFIDYRHVSVIYEPGRDRRSLAERIEQGRDSWFFAHHADYAWATTAVSPGEAMPAFKRATHYLLDARLMMAWSQAYAENGDVEKARHIADRLREFRNPTTRAWFAECDSTAFVERPYQCTPATQAFTWRDFR